MKPALARVLFGTDEVVPETLSLRAGPLDLALRGAKLWHLRLGEVEVWHGVAFLFRDPDWGTPEPIVDHIESTLSEQSFLISCIGRFPTSPVIDFRMDLEGTSVGCVRLSGEAVPRADIQSNRLGICVMHPMAAAGARIEVTHTDRRSSHSTFPTLIPPWPPFMLIRAIRHEYSPGYWARCEFAGDSFELEDQRNNSDASFKTYSRSNLMPRPYWLRAGVPIRQSVELRLEEPWTRTPPRHATMVTVRVGDAIRDLPRVGIEISPRDVDTEEPIRAALQAMRPAHLHLALEAGGGAVDWKRIHELLRIAGANLRLDLTLGELARADELLEALRDDLRDAGLMPESIAIFPSEQRCLDAARQAFPSSLIGGGTPYFFVQLNRIESLGAVDFLTFTTSPIVHGADDEPVMLTLQSLPSMIATLNARYPGLPIRIGPSSIATRKSPLGNQPETDGTRRLALAKEDPRCRGLYGAAWSLGYVAQLAAMAGVDAITLMSLSGASGILGLAGGGAVRRNPTYFVLERLMGPARVCNVSVSEPQRIAAAALSRKTGRELLLANLTGEAIDIQLDGWAASCGISIMDADAWRTTFSVADPWDAARRGMENSRLRLEAYAVASLDEHS
jgi:hypothetical protein